MDKQIINLTIFLMKDYVEDFNDCLKSPTSLSSSQIKQRFGLDGSLYYCDSNKKPPRWKQYVDELTTDAIDISDNSSNKAVLLVRIDKRIMAVVFGYGRSFLREEYIERNFGFKVALNTINPNKMRSINAATVEDMVVTTQRQASYSTSQDEFGLNVTNDIMKGITGEPFDVAYGNHISGKDSLVVSVFMNLSELKDKLMLYLTAYKGHRYKDIGFEWVDNIAEVRDSVLSEALDFELADAISNRNTEHLHIAPPETTDWDRVIGFCYSGIGKRTGEQESYDLNLDLSTYIERIRPGTNVYDKIKRDKLYAMTADGIVFTVSSIYTALVFQTEYEGKNYILCAGSWYQVETSFFELVNNYIRTHIPISAIDLPPCEANMYEADYNRKIADENPDYCLMDQYMIAVENGPKKIEACDIFTKQKQLIHVKNKGQSAQLSHLFAQGKISAECFVGDEQFRRQVCEQTAKKFGSEIFDYNSKPRSNEYEVIYAIIDDKNSTLVEKLPFFSKVNLMLTAQELDRMHFRCSVCLIKRKA